MPFTYTRELSDDEMAILKNDIADVKMWIDGAIDGKLNKCKKRIQKTILEKEDFAELIAIDANPVKAFLIRNESKKEEEIGRAEITL